MSTARKAAPRPVQPRKMWATYDPQLETHAGQGLSVFQEQEDAVTDLRDIETPNHKAFPVLVVPLDPASVAALTEQIALSLSGTLSGLWVHLNPQVKDGYRAQATAALAAIGIRVPAPKGKGREAMTDHHCDECDPSFLGCWNGLAKCWKKPTTPEPGEGVTEADRSLAALIREHCLHYLGGMRGGHEEGLLQAKLAEYRTASCQAAVEAAVRKLEGKVAAWRQEANYQKGPATGRDWRRGGRSHDRLP